MAWRMGEAIVRLEVWRGKPWLGTVVFVVEDMPDLLASYLPKGSPFGFPKGNWPGDGRHPWRDRIGRLLGAGERWWDEVWSRWEPPAGWIAPPLAKGWDVV